MPQDHLPVASSSASGIIALLAEPDVEIKEHALTQLDSVVDVFWAEISEAADTIKSLSADSTFPASELASLLLSKLNFHIGNMNESIKYALRAGKLFSLAEESEFAATLVAKCVETYASVRKSNAQKIAESRTRALVASQSFDESSVVTEEIDPKLEDMINRMFDRCFEDGEFRQAAGLAVECLRLDYLEQSVKQSNDIPAMLQYVFDVATKLVINRSFRQQLLTTLVRLYAELSVPDYLNIVRCHVFLNRPSDTAAVFVTILNSGDPNDGLLAFQIAFELVDNATQQFLKKVLDALPQSAAESLASFDVSITTLRNILRIPCLTFSGKPTLKFYLEFLYAKSKADTTILTKLKDAFEPRLSVLHQGVVVANAYMHCGTTRDNFLRSNMDWLKQAHNWAKFTTTACLGAIHKGHLAEAMNVLDPYLPKPGVEASPYTEGGSLFGLGLIHANQGANTVTHYILQCLRNIDAGSMASNGRQRPGELDETQKKEIVQHGASLGLGVAAMASGLEDAFDELLKLLFQHDSAVAGEAAGVSLGLVMLGTATERAEEMLNFAHVSRHDKVVRSIGLGLVPALIMYGLEEKADVMIERLAEDKDPLLRYGGMFTIGLAYHGTANNSAIKKLLHYAVSDVSDDVRRAAVISLGFVMFRRPEQVPRLVRLLSESYNPHVRYGAAIAVGIACAGTGMPEAIELLDTLTKESTPFVRQGAFIALSMVLIEVSEKSNPQVKEKREMFLSVVTDKHQHQAAKLGAILALGILDAGGRNCTIALSSRAGHTNLCGVVGIFLFLQFWYWYPFQLFLSLAFTPTAIIAVNRNLAMPTYQIKSNARPSLFAYPEMHQEAKEEEVKTVAKAELSITKKAKLRQSRLKKLDASPDTLRQSDSMEVETPEPAKPAAEEKPKEPEPTFELLDNPARVTRQQFQHITFDVSTRYFPVTEGVHGIIVLRDSLPAEDESLIESGVPVLGAAEENENEPEPPPPFEFLG